ncbi:phosphate ABC transporter substrate-binding protein [Ligilactobacillus sp. WILCCON 0076]|uniref:Phosphate-binding protein n=1 Tax=Ligilactobacillus ubinensis TaxID=2876789 RepID=A0A9X2FHR9_9LACO|nr:phosphate ABC transporter substrate-binding protein [Ligilactobacillus ubinensis]MCP0886312.1 phosphate ABC transporter substrate-binding protein [Ligilactobacillus ubinensis]
MKKKIRTILLTLSAVLFLSACSSTNKNKQITIVGSTALQPIVEVAAEEYQTTNAKISITVQGGGSGTGLSQVQTGAVTIGNSDIFANQQSGIKAKKLVDHKVAVVGIGPIVNKKTGVKNLSLKQLQGIFTGKYTNWKQLGGKNQEIIVINRAQGSGTRATFEQHVLQGKNAINTQEQDSSGTVEKMVASTPGAISYVAFSYFKKDVTALKVDNIKPTDKNVTTNTWKIWAYEHMYTKGKPDKQTQKFLDYMLSATVQNKLIKKLGYISIHDMKVTTTKEKAE